MEKFSHILAQNSGNRITPHIQGSLDGMCGIYAIANALQLCGIDRGDEVLRAACAAVNPSRWPSIYWTGTSLGDLSRMLRMCRAALEIEETVRVGYPFRKRPARTAREFWKRLDTVFQDKSTICAIIGIVHPMQHWIVMRKIGQRLEFVDSTPDFPIFRKNRGGIRVMCERPQALKSAWIIDGRALITFHLNPDLAIPRLRVQRQEPRTRIPASCNT